MKLLKLRPRTRSALITTSWAAIVRTSIQGPAYLALARQPDPEDPSHYLPRFEWGGTASSAYDGLVALTQRPWDVALLEADAREMSRRDWNCLSNKLRRVLVISDLLWEWIEPALAEIIDIDGTRALWLALTAIHCDEIVAISSQQIASMVSPN